MQLDMFTAVLCNLASHLVALFCIVVILKSNPMEKKGIKEFLLLYIFLTVGIFLILLRGEIPVIFSIVIANMILLLARYFFIRGINKVLGRTYNYIGVFSIIALATAGLVYFTYFQEDLQIRIIITTSALILINLLILLIVYKKDIRKVRECFLIRIMSMIYIAINCIRLFNIVVRFEETNELMNLKIDPFTVVLDGVASLVMVIALLSIINGLNKKRSEEKTREVEFFANIYEISPVPVLAARGNDSIIHANPSLCKLTMQTCENISGSSWIDIFVPNKLSKKIRNSIHKNKKGKEIYHTAKIHKYDGRTVEVEIFITLHYDEFEILDYYYVFFHDLTIINTIQEKSLEATRQKNSILSNIPGFTYRCLADRNWTMIELSNGFSELTGYNESDFINNKKMAFNDIILEEFQEEVWNNWNTCIKDKVPYIGEYKIRLANGETCWIWEHGQVVESEGEHQTVLEGFITDISRRKLLEEKNDRIEAYLLNQQKMEAIGTLAAGVAHEINNPINGIMNYAQLINDKKSEDSESSFYASEIISESDRISKIVSSLLQFSGHQSMGPKLVEMKEPFLQTLELFKATIKKSLIEINISIEDNLPPVICECSKMQQVLMNLLTNAKDALNNKYEGFNENKIIDVAVGRINDEEGDWLRISVKDYGSGIPEHIQPYIFEPFFTTKDRAMGTGLGLSISYGIVKDHKGRLSFDSKPDEYTQFNLDLPDKPLQ